MLFYFEICVTEDDVVLAFEICGGVVMSRGLFCVVVAYCAGTESASF